MIFQRIIKLITLCIAVSLLIGFYYKNSGDVVTGDRIIGLSVLATAFVLMPVFIYHRYKNKNLKDFQLFKSQDSEKDVENQ